MVAVYPDGRVVDDPPQRRRRSDSGPKPIDRRPRPIARRDRDDDGLRLLERLLQARLRLRAVELIGFDALATQRGDALRGPRGSARLDPGLALNEAPGAIAEAEEEDFMREPRPAWPIPFPLRGKVSPKATDGGARPPSSDRLRRPPSPGGRSDSPTSSWGCRGRSACPRRLRPTWRRSPRASGADGR